MSYMDIDNLYKNQDILMLKECYAMEKIHGTSAHISWQSGNNPENPEPPQLTFFSGGAKHEAFIKLFDQAKLTSAFMAMDRPEITIYGEAYGGKEQGMSHTYGKELKFIVFDIKIGHSWLNVPAAEKLANDLELEFVSYEKVPTTIEALDAQRDLPSVQAVRNGILEPKKREGVVLRPLIELKKNNGERIIAKHKAAEFQERKSQPKADISPEQLKILEDAKAIAEEWAVPVRLTHILQHFAEDNKREPQIEDMGVLLKGMVEDIEKEAAGEIVISKEARKAISKKTSEMLREKFTKIPVA
jgi:hypothetical protein